MARPRTFVILLGAAAAAVAIVRHGRGAVTGRRVPGGILIGDAVVYDALSRLVLGSLFGRIAAEVAAVAPDGVIEAIESNDPDWFCMGVQWHPASETASALDMQLFESLIAACGKRELALAA